MEILSDKDATINDTFLDSKYEEIGMDLFEQFNNLNTSNHFMNDFITMESTNGTVYAKKIAQDILASGGTIIEDFCDTQLANIAAAGSQNDADALTVIATVLNNLTLQEIQDDVLIVYPNLKIADVENLSISVGGESLSGDVKIGELRQAVIAKLNGKTLSQIKGQSIFTMTLNGKTIELVVNQVAK